MKRINWLHISLSVVLSVSALSSRADWDQYMFDSVELRDQLSMTGRPIYFDNEDNIGMDDYIDDMTVSGSLHYKYLPTRRALTGETCAINKMINSVGIGSWNGELESLINEDLNDYCEFNSVVSLGVATDPIVSVRDRSCYYAKGTTAGFCLVAGSGNSVVSLDLISAASIGFYRDGEVVGLVGVKQGQDAGLLSLELIQIPGSDAACVNLEVVAPGVFDEIALDYSGAVNVSGGQILRIKYAYVGKSIEYSITKYNRNKNKYGILPNTDHPEWGEPLYRQLNEENADVLLKSVSGSNAVLLGIPFPMNMDNYVDDDLTNSVVITPIASIGYQGGSKFRLYHSSEELWGQEVFPAGTEVGFCYDFGGALSLGLGTWLNIRLFDANGNIVQSEDIKGQVLSLGLVDIGTQSTSIISSVPFSGAEVRFMTTLSVDLGVYNMHYAYVRGATESRHRCPINPSASTDICRDQQDFQLKSNPDVSVSWSLVKCPAGSKVSVTADGYVSGMDPTIEDELDENPATKDEPGNHEYIFKATAADGCEDYVVLTHRRTEDAEYYSDLCGTPIMDAYDKGEYVVVTEETYPGLTGGLLHFDMLDHAENVLSPSMDDYATYVGGLEVATNTPVVGVARTDGLIFDATEEGAVAKRMGFVVASSIEGLNLNALQFWQVRCYHNGSEVYRHVIDESNVVSTEIGGSNRAQKMRYSINVPLTDNNGDPMKIDALVLWSSGVASVGGGELFLYYAFQEDADSGCDDPMGCSTMILSTTTTHTTLDFAMMQSGSAIVVANAVNDLDNFVDSDMESYMSVANSVTAGSGIPIAVKLGRTVDYRHQLGIVMDNQTFLAGVNAGSWLTIETYYNGVPTGDKFDDWNAIDANVIGYGDRNVLIVQPKFVYDEVKLTIGKVIGALDILKFYGMFLRGDIDNDGIPDCQDFSSCTYTVRDVQPEDVCEGDIIEISGIGQPEAYYWVRFSEPGIPADQQLQKIQAAAEGGKFYAYYTTQKAGKYQMLFYDNQVGGKDKDGNQLPDEPGKPLSAAEYVVHPYETEWLTTATNSDWNKWDNWSEGSPYCCTRVIIPSDAVNYPDLAGDPESGDKYCCEYIHFKPGAQVNRVFKLNYERAWVDLALRSNRYYLLSAPLKAMYTGDMFVANPDDLKVALGDFSHLDVFTYPQNRFNPTIYQRKWSTTVYDHLWGSDVRELTDRVEFAEMATAQWTRNFNLVSSLYRPAEGFSVWVDNGIWPDDEVFTFLFPKEHTQYDYYNKFDGQSIGVTETVRMECRDDDGNEVPNVIGRFTYESGNAGNLRYYDDSTGKEGRVYDRTVYTASYKEPITITAEKPSKYLLFGNPLMSNINVKELILGHQPDVTGVMIYDGNTMRKIEYRDGEFINKDNIEVIAPFESAFLTFDTEVESYNITLTEQMLTLADAVDAPESRHLRISISDGNFTGTMAVADIEAFASPAVLDNEVMPSLAVYALDNGEVKDIVGAKDIIELAIINNNSGNELTLSFRSSGISKDDYLLYDKVTGESYSLDEEVKLPKGVGTVCGRYMLVSNDLVISPDDIKSSMISDLYVEVYDDVITVHSVSGGIRSVAVYDMNGICLSSKDAPRTADARKVTLSVTPGIRLINVLTEDGKHAAFRVMVR